MNDFTKDELIALKNGIDYLPNSVNLDKKYREMCEGVFKKLQSMIDNYCEHESSGEVRDVDYVKVCTQCKEVTGWQ